MDPPFKGGLSPAELGHLCLMHLTKDPAELSRFMVAVGYDPDGLRVAVGTEALATGLIDYFAANEPLMLALCSDAGIKPATFMRIWQEANRSD